MAARAGGQPIIYTGWDSPTPKIFREEAAEFEKLELFDGTTIFPTRRLADGSIEKCAEAFSTNHWEWSEFADCVSDLKEARPQRATNNFLIVLANPGNVGWFDDPGWKEVTEHWRLLARAAREGGLQGLVFDSEPYRKPWAQFSYAAQADHGSHSFPEMSRKARQRGQEVMKAIAEEFPGMTLLAYRLLSDSSLPVFGLVPSFVNGWCDALPETMTLVEGNEAGYRFSLESEFTRAFAGLKKGALGLVSAENRPKLQRQMRVGHGIYLDAYVSKPRGETFVNLRGKTPANQLLANVSWALRASDGIVWLYGEKGSWWSDTHKAPSWPEKFPGIESALRAARDPAGFARDAISGAKAEPVSTNSWDIWREGKTKGEVSFMDGAVRLARAENAAIVRSFPVQEGEFFVAGVKMKRQGQGEVGMAIGWQGRDKKWILPERRVGFLCKTNECDLAELVQAPAGAARLGFLLFGRRLEGEVEFRGPVLIPVFK